MTDCYLPELMTDVQRLDYDWPTRTGRLYLPKHCCTDMDGAIALFSRIDPDARAIYTYAGETRDTAYLRGHGGEWRAIAPPRPAA